MCALKSLMSQLLSSTSAKVFVGTQTWGGSAPHPKFLLVGLRPLLPPHAPPPSLPNATPMWSRAFVNAVTLRTFVRFEAIISQIYWSSLHSTLFFQLYIKDKSAEEKTERRRKKPIVQNCVENRLRHWGIFKNDPGYNFFEFTTLRPRPPSPPPLPWRWRMRSEKKLIAK